MQKIKTKNNVYVYVDFYDRTENNNKSKFKFVTDSTKSFMSMDWGEGRGKEERVMIYTISFVLFLMEEAFPYFLIKYMLYL